VWRYGTVNFRRGWNGVSKKKVPGSLLSSLTVHAVVAMARRVFKEAIARQLSHISGVKHNVLETAIEIPKNRTHGEFAIPLPKVIANSSQSVGTPVEWAKQLASKVRTGTMTLLKATKNTLLIHLRSVSS
jgi:Arginyl tRNA synthetase N terminal domain